MMRRTKEYPAWPVHRKSHICGACRKFVDCDHQVRRRGHDRERGEGANRHVVAKIRAELDGDRDIEHVNEIATLHMGPAYIVVTLSVNFRDDMISQTIERSVARLDRDIKALDPRIKRVFIEAEAIATQTVATAAPDAAQTPA